MGNNQNSTRVCTIKVGTTSAGVNVYKDFSDYCSARGVKTVTVLDCLFRDAINHPDDFKDPIKNTRSKKGEKFNASIRADVRNQLDNWVEKNGRSRAMLVCFIIEKGLELGLDTIQERTPPRVIPKKNSMTISQ